MLGTSQHLVWSLAALTLGCTTSTEPAPDETPAEPGLPLESPPLIACAENDGPKPASVVVATWNMGAARSAPLEEVQAQIQALDADVVLLQEVDVGVLRTDEVHQASVLSDALGYDYVFAASLEWDGGVFGLTTLSRLPISGVERFSLEGAAEDLGSEPRIALEVRVCAGADEMRFVNVHADFVDAANANNLAILGDVLSDASLPATLVGGDFNTAVDTPPVVAFLEQTNLADILFAWDPGPTRRQKRIDFLFGPPAVANSVTRAERIDTTTSDHRALLVEFSP